MSKTNEIPASRDLAKQWLNSLQAKGFSPVTLYGKKSNIHLFIVWCEQRDILHVTDVSRTLLESYQRYLSSAPLGRNGDPLLPLSLLTRLRAVKLFFKWIAEKRLLVYNPALEWELPKEPGLKIKEVLSAQEVEAMLSRCDLKTDVGVRDRAVMETLYSTGVRKKELIHLKPEDINVDEGTLKVVEGKGDRQRLVPIGDRALAWIKKYQTTVRERITFNRAHAPYLFLTLTGNPLTHVSEIIGIYKTKANIGKKGLSHLFRHTMATLMLKNGADIRIIQQILGHAHLQTTQRYTHLCIDHLKEVHSKTHPARYLDHAKQVKEEDE